MSGFTHFRLPSKYNTKERNVFDIKQIFSLSIQIQLVTFLPLANMQRVKSSCRKVWSLYIKYSLLLSH